MIDDPLDPPQLTSQNMFDGMLTIAHVASDSLSEAAQTDVAIPVATYTTWVNTS